MERPHYSAFLSYSHRDTHWATWLHHALESYRLPRKLVGSNSAHGPVPKRLLPVFRDREELASATDLGDVIRAALSESDCQIVICSPRSAQSRWVNEEILSFKRLGREHRILPLIIDGEPYASNDPAHAGQECFPPALRYRLGPDGNLSDVPTEPMAADARGGKDGRNNAKLKLIAGILGVRFNELKRREQQRRQRQLVVIAGAATAGMVLTTGLAAVALMARATAQKQTLRAEAEAETARRTTSFLVDLFRVLDPSEARGNSITAREMLDTGARRIDTELRQQPQIQATLMDAIGTVYMGLGLYGPAKPLLEGAVAKRRDLDGLEPRELSQSLNHLGDLLTMRAEYASAEQSFREAIVLQGAKAKATRHRDRENEAALAKSFFGLGSVLAQQGRYEDAERALRTTLETQQQLFHPPNGDIARTLQSLAKVVDQNGRLNEALPMIKSAVTQQRQLRGRQPHPDLAEAINDLAVLLQENSEYDASESYFVEAIAMKRRLLGEHHPEVAMGLSNLALVLHDKGDLEQAEAVYRQALAMQRELLGALHPDVGNTLNNLAFVQYDRGDTGGALTTERESLAVYRTLFSGDHPEVARIMNRIGYWLTLAGEYAEAGRDLKEALGMRQRLLGAKHPDVASSLTHLAILQVATGDYAHALESGRTATEICTTAFSADHWRTAVAESAQGAALAGLRRYPDAEKLLVHSYGILSKDMGVLPTYRSLSRTYTEQLYRQWGRPIQARMYAATKADAALTKN